MHTQKPSLQIDPHVLKTHKHNTWFWTPPLRTAVQGYRLLRQSLNTHTHSLSFFKRLLWQSTGQPGHWRQRQAYERKWVPRGLRKLILIFTASNYFNNDKRQAFSSYLDSAWKENPRMHPDYNDMHDGTFIHTPFVVFILLWSRSWL